MKGENKQRNKEILSNIHWKNNDTNKGQRLKLWLEAGQMVNKENASQERNLFSQSCGEEIPRGLDGILM